MVLVNDIKYACQSCIKGHRSSSCNHTERPLFEIKKKGRPATQCAKCRELRKTKQLHLKCTCDERVFIPPAPGSATVASGAEESDYGVASEPAPTTKSKGKKGKPKLDSISSGPAFPHGVAGGLDPLHAAHKATSSSGASTSAAPSGTASAGPATTSTAASTKSASGTSHYASPYASRNTSTENLALHFAASVQMQAPLPAPLHPHAPRPVTASSASLDCEQQQARPPSASAGLRRSTSAAAGRKDSQYQHEQSELTHHHPAHTSRHVHKTQLFNPYRSGSGGPTGAAPGGGGAGGPVDFAPQQFHLGYHPPSYQQQQQQQQYYDPPLPCSDRSSVSASGALPSFPFPVYDLLPQHHAQHHAQQLQHQYQQQPAPPSTAAEDAGYQLRIEAFVRDQEAQQQQQQRYSQEQQEQQHQQQERDAWMAGQLQQHQQDESQKREEKHRQEQDESWPSSWLPPPQQQQEYREPEHHNEDMLRLLASVGVETSLPHRQPSPQHLSFDFAAPHQGTDSGGGAAVAQRAIDQLFYSPIEQGQAGSGYGWEAGSAQADEGGWEAAFLRDAGQAEQQIQEQQNQQPDPSSDRPYQHHAPWLDLLQHRDSSFSSDRSSQGGGGGGAFSERSESYPPSPFLAPAASSIPAPLAVPRLPSPATGARPSPVPHRAATAPAKVAQHKPAKADHRRSIGSLEQAHVFPGKSGLVRTSSSSSRHSIAGTAPGATAPGSTSSTGYSSSSGGLDRRHSVSRASPAHAATEPVSYLSDSAPTVRRSLSIGKARSLSRSRAGSGTVSPHHATATPPSATAAQGLSRSSSLRAQHQSQLHHSEQQQQQQQDLNSLYDLLPPPLPHRSSSSGPPSTSSSSFATSCAASEYPFGSSVLPPSTQSGSGLGPSPTSSFPELNLDVDLGLDVPLELELDQAGIEAALAAFLAASSEASSASTSASEGAASAGGWSSAVSEATVEGGWERGEDEPQLGHGGYEFLGEIDEGEERDDEGGEDDEDEGQGQGFKWGRRGARRIKKEVVAPLAVPVASQEQALGAQVDDVDAEGEDDLSANEGSDPVAPHPVRNQPGHPSGTSSSSIPEYDFDPFNFSPSSHSHQHHLDDDLPSSAASTRSSPSVPSASPPPGLLSHSSHSHSHPLQSKDSTAAYDENVLDFDV